MPSALSIAVARQSLQLSLSALSSRFVQIVGTIDCSQLLPLVIGTNSSSADGGLPRTFGVQAAVIGEPAFGSNAPNPVSDPRSWQSAAW